MHGWNDIIDKEWLEAQERGGDKISFSFRAAGNAEKKK
jgi:hypothetical protein